MHIMTTIDLKSGLELNHLNTKSFLAKFAEDNTSRFTALDLRKATYLDMQNEIDRLEAGIKLEEICLANASWGGGHSNKLKISTFKTRIINLNAAISAIGAEKLMEVSA